MDQRRPGHPDDVAAAFPLLDEELREVYVVHGLLARHLARHELELTVAVAAGRFRVNEDPFATILLLADGYQIAGAYPAHLADPELARPVEDERGVHPRLARETPPAGNPDVCWKIRRGEEIFGQHAVGRGRNEARVRRRRETGCAEVGMRNLGHGAKDAWVMRRRPTPFFANVYGIAGVTLGRLGGYPCTPLDVALRSPHSVSPRWRPGTPTLNPAHSETPFWPRDATRWSVSSRRSR
jgi:hypothetical protein